MRRTNFVHTALAAAFLLTGIATAGAAEIYQFDKGYTEVRFSWDHAGVSI